MQTSLARAVPAPGPVPESTYGRIGALLLDAGMSVSDVRDGLEAACATATPELDLTFSVLPQTVMVSDDRTGETRMASAEGALTFRQSAQASRLSRGIARGSVGLAEVPERIDAIRAQVRRHPVAATTVGSALIATGLATLFRCPWWAEGAALVLGALIGAAVAVSERRRPAASVMPFVTAFLAASAVGTLADLFDIGTVPLAAVCAPFAVLVPGALITNALLELTSTDIVAGAARLMYGAIALAFMAAGIAAGASLTGLHLDPTSAGLVGDIPGSEHHGSAWSAWSSVPPEWLSVLGVVLLALGVSVAFGAGRRLAGLGVVVMLGTYAVVTLASVLTTSVVASGIAAGLLLVVARAVERLRDAVPATVTFQPAFLLLVPGTVGLVAISSTSTAALATAGATFASVCIGTQLGALVASAMMAP
ncbi:threonine/serine exporter family protein [Nocardioides sp. BP30]|uniref:threonine/serine exporter family protein n=1 Tax=Nocardioides sp. BP30 TaxID=3036374 RepID=UPI00246981BA|nr:threonine/serine exporter family protein [Nocardioides sp. BP30]WGL50705.1 threonine/serine exporter family protein [Nocardioides sp. BP30]